MREEKNIVKIFTVVLFMLFLMIGFIKNNSYKEIGVLFQYLSAMFEENADSSYIDDYEKDFTSAMSNQEDLINVNGNILSYLKVRDYYKNDGIYVSENGYLISSYKYTSTDYEYTQTVEFRDFLAENNINLLYVNEPTKYVDDSIMASEFGVETYSNRNMDTYLNRIREAGISTIDLRDNLEKEGKTSWEMFYRTDHHWTVPAGLWAASIIAEGLNEHCGYNIDTTIYNSDNFEYAQYNNCWLGEQGQKIGLSYIGTDDFVEVKPRFDTDFSFVVGNEIVDGSFDNMINEDIYFIDLQSDKSWHYSYNFNHVYNNKVESGRVLVIGDSFDHVMCPFLTLGVHEVDFIILRSCPDDFSVRQYILENEYDTVIIAYAQFMLGAHDNYSSENYKIYTFE